MKKTEKNIIINEKLKHMQSKKIHNVKKKKHDEIQNDKLKHIKRNSNLENDKIEYPPKSIKKKKRKHKIVRFVIRILIIIFIILSIFWFFKLHTFKILAKEMLINTPSTIYDSNNNVIAQIGSERNRENLHLNEVPQDLKNAYISIEDKRYYSHHGVDIKRTTGAIISYILHRGSSSFGGSTITQQLAKNLNGDSSNSISRKVKEWFYAWTLNINFSKDAILEAYLNIIYTGPNIYGVKTASKYYFNKDVSELTTAECAFLAGINNSPNSYNPFGDNDKTEKINKRCKVVLNQMKLQKYLTEADYNKAISEIEQGLKFDKGILSTDNDIYSYHTDALINEIISDLSSSKHISKDFAHNFFRLSGTKIYSTINNNIQNILEKESINNKYIIKSVNGTDTSQAAIVVVDHSTGFVVGCVGGLGEKTSSRSFNRVTQMKRQTGSAMKPVAVLVPAISKKLITNVTVFADEPTTFIDYNNKPYSPIDYDDYKGSITLRQAVESSQNIPFVKIIEQVTPKTSIKYLKKMGITTLNENDENLALSLGGLDEGISPLEFAGSYATIANNRHLY